MSIKDEANLKRAAIEVLSPDNQADPAASLRADVMAFQAEERSAAAALEAQRDELAAKLKVASDQETEERRAILAETSTGARADMHGKGKEQEQKRARKKQLEKDALNRLLLEQLDTLNAQILGLNREIDDILGEHLSPEEMAYLDTLPEEEKHREQMRIMREKLERGEISQDEFDEFEGRWNVRAKAMHDKKRVQNIMDHGTDAEKSRAAQTEKIDVVRDTRYGLDAPMKKEVENTLEARDDTGNVAAQNNDAEESFIFDQGSALGGNPLSPGTGTSVAASLTAGLGLNGNIPPVRPEFLTASTQMTAPQVTAQVEPDQTQEKTSFSPTPTMS